MKRTTYSRQKVILLELLIEARREIGLSQTELAGHLGITQSEVSKFERGERSFDVMQLRAWVEVGLNLPFEWFIQEMLDLLSVEEHLVGLSRRDGWGNDW